MLVNKIQGTATARLSVLYVSLLAFKQQVRQERLACIVGAMVEEEVLLFLVAREWQA